MSNEFQEESATLELWNTALSDLRGRLSTDNFDTWLSPIRYLGIENNTVKLSIPNRFSADWVRTHYLGLIVESLCKRSGLDTLEVQWEIDESLAPRGETKPASSSKPTTSVGFASTSRPGKAERHATGLNHKYCFDNFVVGPSNQLAHATSIASASNPGKRYNPLFLYGGVGLGKTHLVNAVGLRVLESHPRAKILYTSAERFTNEYIWALQNHQISEFRDRFRNQYDVVLIDDIQFLAKREQTQEEFFHTFNALYHSDKQIVVTCDVNPQHIPEMEERLVSRFKWGMVADIQEPEIDTRVAIVKKKSEQEGIYLPNDVALFIAEVIKSNVRELEGTLLRLAVRADLLNSPISLELAQEVIQPANLQNDKLVKVEIEDIQRAVCEYFNIRLAEMKSHKRHRSLAHPRMIAMYICRKKLGTSYTELGWRFGGKDHTTVMNGVRKIGSLIEKQDSAIHGAVQAIELKLGR